jgi:putative ABC transport system permease protein
MIAEDIRTAIESISANRLRSFLTMLGIIVAVSSVVMIVALGNAAERQIKGSLEGLGTQTVLVYVTPGQGGVAGATQGVLTERDADALRRAFPDALHVVPQISNSVRVVFEDKRSDTSLLGVTPDYFSVVAMDLLEGSLFSSNDVAARSVVVVLGRSTSERLFEGQSAVGRRVRINGVPAEVVGVAAARGSGTAGDQNDFVLAPVSSMRQRLGAGTTSVADADAVGTLLVKFAPETDLAEARERVVSFFEDRKNIDEDEINPFTVSTSEELGQATSAIVNVLQAVLGSIASISLIVGGIGIANIMLASVAERTWEIGLRMAVGAQPRQIRNQFLVEACILCVIGGILGLAVAAAFVFIVGAVSNIPISISFGNMVLAIVMSGMTGLIAGYVPARRAAALDPIVALRRD